jgi:hypothetical protein
MSKHRRAGTAAVVIGLLVVGFCSGRLVSAKSPLPWPPFGMDDLLGVWDTSISSAHYDLSSGQTWKSKEKGTYSITDNQDGTVNMHYNGPTGEYDTTCYVVGGVLMSGYSDLDGTACYAAFAPLKGKTGRLSGTAQYIMYDLNEDSLEAGTFTLKQR